MTSPSLLQCHGTFSSDITYAPRTMSHGLHSDDNSPPQISVNRRSSSSSTSTLSTVPPLEDSVLSPPVGTDSVAHRLTFKTNPSLLEPPSKDRKLSRCESEKLRRDRVNAYTGELAKIVPLVMQSNRKIDKASVLRLTVTYLRIHHDLIGGSHRKRLNGDWPCNTAAMGDLASTLLDSFDGFLLVVNTKGVIIYVTEAITTHLGHNLADILGCSLYTIIHQEDHELLRKQLELSPNDLLVDDIEDDGDVNHTPVRGQRSFCVRMQNVKDSQTTAHNTIHIVGHLRRMPGSSNDASSRLTPGNQRSGMCLIGIARMEQDKQITELYPKLNDSPRQWITRHELDGKITYSDQRGACLTGFLPGESMGLSAYSLVHPKDIPYIVAMHKYFFHTGEKQETIFRTFTKSCEILYISNTTHLVVDMWTKKAKFIISINHVLSNEEGKQRLRDHRIKVRALTAGLNLLSPVPNETADVDNRPICAAAHQTSNPPVFPPKVNIDNCTVSVTVGDQQFVVDIATEQTFGAHHQTSSDGQLGLVFDPHTSDEDGGRSIPLVEPVFLGTPSDIEICADLCDVIHFKSPNTSNCCIHMEGVRSQESSSVPQAQELLSMNKCPSTSLSDGNSSLLRHLLGSQESYSIRGRKDKRDDESCNEVPVVAKQDMSEVKTVNGLELSVGLCNGVGDVSTPVYVNGNQSSLKQPLLLKSTSTSPTIDCRANGPQNSVSSISSCWPLAMVGKHSVSTNVDCSESFERLIPRYKSCNSTVKQSMGLLHHQSVNNGDFLSQTAYHNGIRSPQVHIDRYICMKDVGQADHLSWPSDEDLWSHRNSSFNPVPETASAFIQTQSLDPYLMINGSSNDCFPSINLSSPLLYDFNPHETFEELPIS